MSVPGRLLFVGPLLSALALAPALAQAPSTYSGSAFVHKGHGIRLKLPKGFQRMPVEKDRGHVIGHFLSTKSHPVRGSRRGYRPSFRVLWFPASEQRDLELTYKDYRDYLAKNLSGRLTVKKDSDLKVGRVTCKRLRVRRSRRVRGRARGYRLLAWSFERDKGAFVVECMLVDAHADKMEQPFETAMKSFRFLKRRDPALIEQPVPVPLWRKDAARWAKLEAPKRVDQRRRHQEALHERARQDLLPGWKVKETDAGLIVSDAGERYMSTVARAAVACREFLQVHFGELSDELYVDR